MKKYAIGMVFGVFDGLHEGHKHFLDSAQQHSTQLIVVLTEDSLVKKLKHITPHYNYTKRYQALHTYNKNLHIVPSDAILGSWDVLKTHTPTIVILGYDQHGIARELDTQKMPYIYLPAYKPEHYKSSILFKRN